MKNRLAGPPPAVYWEGGWGQTVCWRAAEWGGHCIGCPFGQHVTKFAEGGDRPQ